MKGMSTRGCWVRISFLIVL